MSGAVILTYTDYAGENSTLKVPTRDLDSWNWAEMRDAGEDLVSVCNMLSRGRPFKRQYTALVVRDNWQPASDHEAQRELKWVVSGKADVSGLPVRLTIPCADVRDLDPRNRDHILYTGTPWIELKQVLESIYRTPMGETVTFTSCVIVGRNI